MSRSGQRHEHRRQQPRGTVTALTVITVTSVVFLEGTAAGPASTKRKSTLA